VTVIDFSAFIGRLATSSGETILPFFRTSLSVDNKSTGQEFDPVTEADRAAEAMMRRLIKANFPQHGIVGEEFGNEREDADYVWVLDPIDGTKSFIGGFPIWGTLIALLHKGSPVFGMMHQPFIGERFSGDNASAAYVIHGLDLGEWSNGEPVPKVGESFFVRKVDSKPWTRTFSVNTP